MNRRQNLTHIAMAFASVMLSATSALAEPTAKVLFRCDLQYIAGTTTQSYLPAPLPRTCSANIAVSEKPGYIPARHFPVSCVIPAGQTSCGSELQTGIELSQIVSVQAYATPALTSLEAKLGCNYIWGVPSARVNKLYSTYAGGESSAYYTVNLLSTMSCSKL